MATSDQVARNISVLEDATEVFEITDFTTASDWERFVSEVEEVLNEWTSVSFVQRRGRTDSSSTNKRQHDLLEETAQVTYMDTNFTVTHFFHKSDISVVDSKETTNAQSESCPKFLQQVFSSSNDFPSVAHCLSRWFGLSEFIILRPQNDRVVTNESRLKLLLSTLSLAAHNCTCAIPLFVLVGAGSRRLYSGVASANGLRTEFDIAQMARVPRHFKYLSGLLDMFKQKTASPIDPHPPISVAIRFTYVLHNFSSQLQFNEYPEILTNKSSDYDLLKRLGHLSSGSCEEPIGELQLAATWPRLSEEMVVDNEAYSDLDPLQAPHWSLRVRFLDEAVGILSDALNKYLRLCARRETVQDLLAKLFAPSDTESGNQMSSALNKITQPKLNIPRMSIRGTVHRATSRLVKEEDIPLSDEDLNSILFYLFPDANEGLSIDPSSDQTVSDSIVQLVRELKCAPVNSLAHRLAISICVLNHRFGGIHTVAHLWQEVVLEFRYRWEHSCLLSDCDDPNSPPDMATSLIHQKLHMLNICIQRKINRERAVSEELKSHEDTEDEDEFFECASTEEEMTLDSSDSWKPVGRSSVVDDVHLLHHSDVPMYAPITQEPAPLTEDMLEEQVEILSKLGTDAEGRNVRAKMQSSSLLSDMQAFKAANPGCVLEDFVRWHSPRDYSNGELSGRMKLPGNIWLESWQQAKPIPVRLQRRLFDDTKEVERILHYFSSLKPAEVAQLLLPNVVLDGVLQFVDFEDPLIPKFSDSVKSVCENIVDITRDRTPDLDRYGLLIKQIAGLELQVSRMRSLKHKFFHNSPSDDNDRAVISEFIGNIISKPDVHILGAARGPLGVVVQKIFMDSTEDDIDERSPHSASVKKNGVFPEPAGKEFILRSMISRPGPGSRPTVQRMFCVMTRDDYRYCGAFSKDTTFV